MSHFTEEHQKGVDAFTESLEQKTQSCSDCGFTASVLHSDWLTEVETDPQTGHIQYELTCPDCHSVEVVDIDI